MTILGLGSWAEGGQLNGNGLMVINQPFCSKPNYSIPEQDKVAFVAEVEDWIGTDVLVPWNEREHGTIPLMSVKQSKGEESKVRPVIDFRVLNEKVLCLSSDMPTCDERLREWRAKGCNGSLVDLRRAYLQVHVEQHLWLHQAVRSEGKVYLLTRLGFGLNIAPKIMTAIV